MYNIVKINFNFYELTTRKEIKNSEGSDYFEKGPSNQIDITNHRIYHVYLIYLIYTRSS